MSRETNILIASCSNAHHSKFKLTNTTHKETNVWPSLRHAYALKSRIY